MKSLPELDAVTLQEDELEDEQDYFWDLDDEDTTSKLMQMRWTLKVSDGDDPEDKDWLPDSMLEKVEERIEIQEKARKSGE